MRAEGWEPARMFVLCDEALLSKSRVAWPLDKLRLDPPPLPAKALVPAGGAAAAVTTPKPARLPQKPILCWTDDAEIGQDASLHGVLWQIAKVPWPERTDLFGMVAAAVIPVEQASCSAGPAHRVAVWAYRIDAAET